MKAVRSHGWVLVAVLALFGAGCGESTGPGFTTGDLTTELAVAPGHLHAFQTTVTFTVAVTDPDGNPVTDFNVLQVERRLVGGTTYSVMEATLVGDFYVVQHVFEGSGEYDIRVTGLRPSDTSLAVLYQQPTPLEVVMAHEDVGGYKVQFEPNPGHIHEGDTSTIQFWILDDTDDSPITGLTPEIFVVEPASGGTPSGETLLSPTGDAAGRYFVDFTFAVAGEHELGIRISAADALDGIGGEFAVPVEVHEAH